MRGLFERYDQPSPRVNPIVLSIDALRASTHAFYVDYDLGWRHEIGFLPGKKSVKCALKLCENWGAG